MSFCSKVMIGNFVMRISAGLKFKKVFYVNSIIADKLTR